MKNMLMALSLVAVMACAAAEPAAAEKKAEPRRSAVAKVGDYLLNRVLDFTDIVSLNIGVGPAASAEVTATEFCRVGFSYGDSAEVCKGFRRQYGVGRLTACDFSFLCFSADTDKFIPWIGTAQEYYMFSNSFQLINLDEEAYRTRAIDLWSIGARAGLIVNAAVYFHPVEFADFLVGFGTLDLSGDDR